MLSKAIRHCLQNSNQKTIVSKHHCICCLNSIQWFYLWTLELFLHTCLKFYHFITTCNFTNPLIWSLICVVSSIQKYISINMHSFIYCAVYLNSLGPIFQDCKIFTELWENNFVDLLVWILNKELDCFMICERNKFLSKECQ